MAADWAVIALLGAIGVSCVQIYFTYRRQVMLIQPAVEQLETSRANIETQIQESDTDTEEIQGSIADLEKELTRLDETRQRLQEKLSQFEMIEVAPGEFKMGDDEAGAAEYPMHTVLLNAYMIDKCPVTNAQYKMFVDITGHRPPSQWAGGTYAVPEADHPVTNVS